MNQQPVLTMPVRSSSQHYNALPPAARVALYGKHLFELRSAAAAAHGDCAQVRLSSLGWTPCGSLEEALQLHSGYIDQWRDEGLPDRDLASSVGYVADAAGNIAYWISPNGQIHAVRYLGDSASLGGFSTPLASAPLPATACSLEKDQADNGAPYFTCGADLWLQEQIAGGEAPRQRSLSDSTN